jgi:hypothetical protein
MNAFLLSDSLGPSRIIHVYEPALDLKAVLVIDNVACGSKSGTDVR